MDKQLAKVVQTEVGEAIKAIYEKHGLTITSNRSTYDDSTFNLSVKAVASDPDSQAKTWAKYAPLFGLPLDGIGQVINLNRKAYRITGLDLSRRTFPVRVEEVGSGKVSLFKEDAIRRALSARISVPA